MKKTFTKLFAALALLAFFIPSFTAMSQDIVVTLDNIGAGLGSTANTTEATTDITATGTTDVYTLNYLQCKKQGNAMLMTKSVSPYISNHTAMPGKIKSVEVFINSGASGKTTYDCAFSTTECHSAVSGIGAVNITGGNSHTFSNLTGGVINVQGEYFCITLGNANNGQVLNLVITCENSSSTAVATTTTIDDTGITNTDIKDGIDAGSLSASVTYGSPATSVPSASVSWSGNNDAVATIDASTGAVTLHSMGTVKFTATYAGVEDEYLPSSAEYTMNVTDSRYVVSDLTFKAAYGSGPGVADDGVEWTVESDGSESSFDNTKGIHYGTGSAAVQYIRLSTSDITEPIAKVIVNASTANNVSATVGVTIGGSAFGGDAQTLTSSAADYTFASSTNAQGEIIVTVTKPSSATGALYVKSVKVTYLAPAVKAPNIDVPAEFVGSTTATITCETEGASIKYRLNESETWLNYPAGGLNITETTTIHAKAVKGEDESAVVSKTTTKTKPTPTVTIVTTGITNTDVNSGTSAGSLSATVTYNSAAVSGATVTWSGDADCVATINETTGAVTLVGAGQVTFTATFAGNGDYLASTDTYVMTVTNSNTNAPGTENNPYTVEEAICAIANNGNVTGVYATGIVKQIVTAYDSEHGNVTFDIVDAVGDEAYLRAYRCGGTDAANVAQGDVVVVSGNMVYFQSSIYEFSQGCQLVSLTHPAVPTITVTPASLTGFTYVVDNGPSTTKTVSVSGANLTANITLSLGDNSDFEMSTTEGSGYTNSLTLTQSEGSVAATTVYVRLKSGLVVGDSYSGTITLSSTDATNKTVSLSGSVTEPVVDYATLPFDWDDTDQPTGITITNTGGYYASSPYIKLNQNGVGTVVLKLNTAPGSIVFDIKGNTGGSNPSTGIFTVSTSANGTDYTTLATYNSISTTVQTMYFTNLSADTRYIKWSYDKTANNVGNVALGNIIIQVESEQSTIVEPVANHIYVVNSGATMILDGDYSATLNNANNLIIEDGGQLILKTGNTVKATIKKTTAVSSATKTAANNLYAIASPVDDIKISSFAQGTHNVYSYDEPNSYWNEYRSDVLVAPYLNPFDVLEIGRGYLYRSNVEGIDFAGDVTGNEVTYILSYAFRIEKYKGLNLVGNPFTHDISWSNLTLSNVESSGCYMLVEDPDDNDHGKWKAVLAASVTVKPMQAFFVQATTGNASITFTNTVGGSKGINYANDNIMFSVKNSKCSDEAYVLFKEGHGLNKIEHRNNEIPMLYIINNGQNYAIADMSDDTEVINIGFEAKTMGQYTLSVKTEGQYSYMHLIDKLTGEDVDMLSEDSYTFVGTPNDRKDRFVLRLNYNAANIDTESDIFAYQSGSDIIVRGEGELQIFDVMGRFVMSKDINGVNTINADALSNGVYVLRIIGTEIKTQKIVVR